MNKMRSDSGTGSGRSRTELTIVKMAVFAPMQIANVKIAVTANPGSFHSRLKANWMSRINAKRGYNWDYKSVSGSAAQAMLKKTIAF